LVLTAEIENGLNILADFPHSGIAIDLMGIRELVFERNSVLYILLEAEVHILSA